MMDVLDKPPVTGGDLPPLPPYLQPKRRGGGGRRVILPCLMRAHLTLVVPDRRFNWVTIVYHYMTRWDFDEGIVETAIVPTRRYRNWLQTYETDDGVPPHVAFGGKIEPSDPDPTMFERWQRYAKEQFV